MLFCVNPIKGLLSIFRPNKMSRSASCPRKRAEQLQILEKLEGIRDTLESRECYFSPYLDDDALESCSIRLGAPFDPDKPDAIEPDTLFFRPLPLAPGQSLPSLLNTLWTTEPWRASLPRWKQPCMRPNCWGEKCHDYRADWFRDWLNCIGGLFPLSEWTGSGVCYGDEDDDCSECDILGGGGFLSYDKYPRPHQFRTATQYSVSSRLKPHQLVFLLDSVLDDSERALKSEALAAISVLQQLLRHGYHQDQSVIPVLVCSLRHDHIARITQAYWDGSSLVLRQSRLLDLDTPEPGEDAYILLQWMTCQLVGDTAKPLYT